MLLLLPSDAVLDEAEDAHAWPAGGVLSALFQEARAVGRPQQGQVVRRREGAPPAVRALVGPMVRLLKETLNGAFVELEVTAPDGEMYHVKASQLDGKYRVYEIKRYHAEGSRLVLKRIGSPKGKRYKEVEALAVAFVPPKP